MNIAVKRGEVEFKVSGVNFKEDNPMQFLNFLKDLTVLADQLDKEFSGTITYKYQIENGRTNATKTS